MISCLRSAALRLPLSSQTAQYYRLFHFRTRRGGQLASQRRYFCSPSNSTEQAIKPFAISSNLPGATHGYLHRCRTSFPSQSSHSTTYWTSYKKQIMKTKSARIHHDLHAFHLEMTLARHYIYLNSDIFYPLSDYNYLYIECRCLEGLMLTANSNEISCFGGSKVPMYTFICKTCECLNRFYCG